MLDKSGPLMGWAVKSALKVVEGAIRPGEVYDEVYLAEVLARAKGAFRDIKAEALNVGKAAHTFLESYLKGENPELPLEGTPVRSCVDAAIAWMDEHRVEPIEVERRVYSRKYKFCGTLDMLARVDGYRALIDWKSSNSIYPEYWIQTAAYAKAFEEEDPNYYHKIKHRYIVRLGKEDGTFEVQKHGRKQCNIEFDAFLGALKLFRKLKEMGDV